MTSVAQPDPVTAKRVAGSGSTPAIIANDLHKVYREGTFFAKKFHALKGVSFEVNQGEIFGLLGPNGAGKTTFIKVLLGIIRKTSGSASMMGYPAGSQRCRSQVGYLPERLRIAPHLTAYSALEYLGNLSNVPTGVIRSRRDEYLDLVGLKGREKESVKKFSKGMVQRLGLAQALLHDPKMLILDEPTDGLDPRARAEMRSIIRRLAERGVTIFLNSHLLQEVEMICERVAILDQGSLRYCGSVADIGQLTGSKPGQTAKQSYRIRVAGSVEEITGKLAAAPHLIVASVEDSVVVQCDISEQSEVDAAVDLIRQNGISIVAMEAQRVSLEDAFLQLIE